MTQADKQRFVNELIGNVRLDILARVPDMPDEWDGLELRRYIAERFQQAVVRLPSKRNHEYRNTVIVCNL